MTEPEPGTSPWLPVAMYVAFVGALFLVAVTWYGMAWDFTTLAVLVLIGWLLWLHLDRANVHDWSTQAADDADRAAAATAPVLLELDALHRRFDALCDWLEVQVPAEDAAPDWAETEEEREALSGAFSQVNLEEPPQPAGPPTDPIPALRPPLPTTEPNMPAQPPQPPTVPQPVTNTTAAVAARRAQQWDDDAEMIAFRQRLDDEEAAFRKHLAALAAGVPEETA